MDEDRRDSDGLQFGAGGEAELAEAGVVFIGEEDAIAVGVCVGDAFEVERWDDVNGRNAADGSDTAAGVESEVELDDFALGFLGGDKAVVAADGSEVGDAAHLRDGNAP
jgi:hypothetical protein